jgi:hypothetical protein
LTETMKNERDPKHWNEHIYDWKWCVCFFFQRKIWI